MLLPRTFSCATSLSAISWVMKIICWLQTVEKELFIFRNLPSILRWLILCIWIMGLLYTCHESWYWWNNWTISFAWAKPTLISLSLIAMDMITTTMSTAWTTGLLMNTSFSSFFWNDLFVKKHGKSIVMSFLSMSSMSYSHFSAKYCRSFIWSKGIKIICTFILFSGWKPNASSARILFKKVSRKSPSGCNI